MATPAPRSCPLQPWVGVLLAASVGTAAAGEYVEVPGGFFAGAIAADPAGSPARVDAFAMRIKPVSKGDFRRFVEEASEWRRDRIPQTFANAGYLGDWQGAATVGDRASESQPVVNVSWFAAAAYCESEGARLPAWNEWEYVAASDENRRDARGDPAWRARILGWRATSEPAVQAAAGVNADVYGVRDMHGVIWEWVDDFNALLVDADSRSGDDADKLKFCGAGAINLRDRENYAVLMRIALLSSLKASDSTSNLGFRCVRPLAKELE